MFGGFGIRIFFFFFLVYVSYENNTNINGFFKDISINGYKIK